MAKFGGFEERKDSLIRRIVPLKGKCKIADGG
jgi:hypothetical protein